MQSRMIDLTETNVNIDNLLDVFVKTQRENGIDVGMAEVDVTIDDDGKVIRDKFGRHTKEMTKEKSSCHNCQKTCANNVGDDSFAPWYTQNKMGLFGEDASDELEFDDDDGDGKYICDYCSETGYKKEYKPYICDTCRACETCSEFEAQDCDGCSYSIYRTGEPYSKQLAKQGEVYYLEDDEKEIIDSIINGEFDDDGVRAPSWDFTIMNYDHTYEK